MKHVTIVATATMSLIVGLAFTPAAATAAGFHGGTVFRGGVVSRPFVGRSFVQRPFVQRPFVHRPFFRHVAPFGLIDASPFVVYASPPLDYYGYASTYYAPSTVYDLPPTDAPPARATMAVAPAPAPPPPMPSVVQYPHGRYELRGDGATTPYNWVWIPNPPPAPPAPSASGGMSSERRIDLYRWTDTQGVRHWTDRLDSVPAQYRAQTERF